MHRLEYSISILKSHKRHLVAMRKIHCDNYKSAMEVNATESVRMASYHRMKNSEEHIEDLSEAIQKLSVKKNKK